MKNTKIRWILLISFIVGLVVGVTKYAATAATAAPPADPGILIGVPVVLVPGSDGKLHPKAYPIVFVIHADGSVTWEPLPDTKKEVPKAARQAARQTF